MKNNNDYSPLHHTIDLREGRNGMIIKISLADDCNNGHSDFSITCEIYERGRFEAGGAAHDEILKAMPSLKMFVDLHLSNAKGRPMYALENGFYHAKNSDITVFMDYMRVSRNEAKKLIASPDKLFFGYSLVKMGILERWEKEAETAIRELEQMTGKKFVDRPDAAKHHVVISEKEAQKINVNILEGYYTPKNIEAREEKAREAAKKAAVDKVMDEWKKEVDKANEECNVKLAVLEADLSIDNFIYYNHSKEGVFNWLDYEKKITESQFKSFLKSVKKKELPKGIKFSLKTK
jgi:hypothetical protein